MFANFFAQCAFLDKDVSLPNEYAKRFEEIDLPLLLADQGLSKADKLRMVATMEKTTRCRFERLSKEFRVGQFMSFGFLLKGRSWLMAGAGWPLRLWVLRISKAICRDSLPLRCALWMKWQNCFMELSEKVDSSWARGWAPCRSDAFCSGEADRTSEGMLNRNF